MKRWVARGVKLAVLAVVLLVVAGGVVMWLWNWLMPATFGLPAIGFAQALGLLVLSRILTGGFRGGIGRRMHWRHRMRERWAEMTPEQRDRFTAGMRRHCGPADGGTAESSGA